MKIELYTDGGCRGNGTETNPVGGVGIVLLIGDKAPIYAYEKLRFEPNTNNKAEIYAIIKGLNLLIKNYNLAEGKFVKDQLVIYSDSAYTVNGITNWINSWRANGWINSKKEEVKNKELWQMLDNTIEKMKEYFDIEFVKVKGHSDNKWNNKCDELANYAMGL